MHPRGCASRIAKARPLTTSIRATRSASTTPRTPCSTRSRAARSISDRPLSQCTLISLYSHHVGLVVPGRKTVQLVVVASPAGPGWTSRRRMTKALRSSGPRSSCQKFAVSLSQRDSPRRSRRHGRRALPGRPPYHDRHRERPLVDDHLARDKHPSPTVSGQVAIRCDGRAVHTGFDQVVAIGGTGARISDLRARRVHDVIDDRSVDRVVADPATCRHDREKRRACADTNCTGRTHDDRNDTTVSHGDPAGPDGMHRARLGRAVARIGPRLDELRARRWLRREREHDANRGAAIAHQLDRAVELVR